MEINILLFVLSYSIEPALALDLAFPVLFLYNLYVYFFLISEHILTYFFFARVRRLLRLLLPLLTEMILQQEARDR